MKKLLTVLAIAMVVCGVLGCQASTLSSKGSDGATLTLENYVVKETTSYNADGRIVAEKRTMVPAKTVLEAALDKVIAGLKSLLDLEDLQDDAAKNLIP